MSKVLTDYYRIFRQNRVKISSFDGLLWDFPSKQGSNIKF